MAKIELTPTELRGIAVLLRQKASEDFAHAKLLDPAGARFIEDLSYHPNIELAHSFEAQAKAAHVLIRRLEAVT